MENITQLGVLEHYLCANGTDTLLDNLDERRERITSECEESRGYSLHTEGLFYSIPYRLSTFGLFRSSMMMFGHTERNRSPGNYRKVKGITEISLLVK